MVDHRPYLLDGVDLVTAEDAARWLDEYSRGSIPNCGEYPELVVEWSARDLRARLDRERRQACRRAALAAWREARYEAHCAARALPMGGGRVGEYEHGMAAWAAMEECLAFRAAARAKP